MSRRLLLVLLAGLGLPATVAACSVYGANLVEGNGGAGGVGAGPSTGSTSGPGSVTSSASSSGSGTSSGTYDTSGSSASSSSSSSSTSGGITARLVLSQVQTRGTNGGNDEFVEIYNPTSAPVLFNASWTVKVRNADTGTNGCASALYAQRFAGGGQEIPAHGHILYANSAGYDGSTTPDGTYATGITDASSVVLFYGTVAIDALCFYYDASTEAALTGCSVPYTCEGTPVENPHDDTTATDTDASLERKPGGAAGNGQDTEDNAADFAVNASPDPRDLASPPDP